MFGKIRPFIFKFDPETAHNLAIQALKFNLMPRNQKQNFKHIETEIFNKKIPNPNNGKFSLNIIIFMRL